MADEKRDELEEKIEEANSKLNEARLDEKILKNNQCEQEEQTRELTQTDHLNKRLLSAFLDRINRATNSGKTTLSRYLVNTLPNCHVICQDNYFFNEGHPNMVWVPEVKHFNWDDLSSLDMKRFTEDVEKWINKQRSILESQKQKKILIVEGFRMLAYKPLAQLFDKKYFITISEAVCKERRSSRVYVPPDVPGYMDKVVWPEYLNHLRELKQETNIEFIDGTEDQDAVKEKILQNILQFLDTKISNI